MKKIAYQAKGYTSVYNPATEQVERREILVAVETEYTEDALEIAKTESYNGEYSIVDDGQTE